MDKEGVHARANARPTSIGWVKRVDDVPWVDGRDAGFFCTRREGVSSRAVIDGSIDCDLTLILI